MTEQELYEMKLHEIAHVELEHEGFHHSFTVIRVADGWIYKFDYGYAHVREQSKLAYLEPTAQQQTEGYARFMNQTLTKGEK